MMRKPFLALAVSAALTVAVFAATSDSPKSSPITMGEFAMKVSKALGREQADPKTAVESLKSLGAKFEADLQARVTEGQAARILTDLGVRVSTSTPAKGLTLGKADQLMALASFSSSAASVSPADEFPTQCLAVKNRGACQECCKAAFGCAPSPALCDFANECAKSCKDVVPPGHQSPDEPLP
jgi:hypothetical protein